MPALLTRFALLAACLPLALACDRQAQPEPASAAAKPAQQAAGGGASKPAANHEKGRKPFVDRPGGGNYEESAYDCCDHEAVDGLVTAYLGLTAVLLEGGEVDEAVGALAAASASAVEAGTLPGPTRNFAKKVQEAVAAMEGGGREGARGHLDAASKPLFMMVYNHSDGGETPVAYAFCPAPPQGHWLQNQQQITNPYSDAPDHLRCGAFK